jgi:hypothetical protein
LFLDQELALNLWIFECYVGTVGTPSSSKKHISSKVVVIILLICVICTTVALLTSVVCYIYRRDRCNIKSPIFSSDKDTSSGSTTNLISYRTGTSSMPETKLFINSPIYHFTGKLIFTHFPLILISYFKVFVFFSIFTVYM